MREEPSEPPLVSREDSSTVDACRRVLAVPSQSDTARPRFIEPMAAQFVDRLPTGNGWGYEIKLDGYRVLILKDDTAVRLISRNNKDLTPTFPHIAQQAETINARTCILDGEIVAVDHRGLPRFQLLQHRSTTRPSQIVYYAFDLLNADGVDTTALPLRRRRTELARIVKGSDLLLSESFPGPPQKLIAAARAMQLEGVIAKRLESPYTPGLRSSDWQKIRLITSQEFVVGGYQADNPFSSILVGYYEHHQLLFASRVRAGFTGHIKALRYQRLQPLQVAACPFANLPSRKSGGWNEGVSPEEMPKMTWVQPRVVVQIGFVEWTTYGLLRHAKFLGIREDKAPKSVSRERSLNTP
jgi:DNA ligase D-like protein (predicted ligase)